MATVVFDFGLFLNVFLFWLAWTMFRKMYKHVQLMSRIRSSGVPGFRGYPVLGLFPVFVRYLLCGPKHIPTNAYLLSMAIGIGKVFSEDGMFLLDGGWLRQFVVIYTKEAVEVVLNAKEQKKSDEYKFFRDFVGSGLLTSQYSKWKKHRRVLSPAFNPRVLDAFQPAMYSHSNILVKDIMTEMHQGNVVIEDVMAKCSLGIVTETAMGLKCGTHSQENLAFLTATREVLMLIGKRIVTPWLWPELLFRISPSGRRLGRNMKTISAFVKEVIRRKKAEIANDPPSGPDQQTGSFKCRPFLEHLLLHNVYCKEEDRLTDDDILDEVFTFTFAGFDTVSVTTYWTMYYLGLHPEVMEKAWTEVNTVMNGDKERDITLDDVKHFEYLDNVIKETQRVRPVIASLLRNLRNDTAVGNVTLPKGTTVAIGIGALHQNHQVFPNGDLFDPDRFKDAKISPFQFLPFSVGPRNCIGQRYAVLEMKTILANLIRHLDWTSLETEDAVLSNPDIVVRADHPLKIHFKQRC